MTKVVGFFVLTAHNIHEQNQGKVKENCKIIFRIFYFFVSLSISDKEHIIKYKKGKIFMKNIGERLSHLLKQNGMTQRELAKKVNVTEAAMSRYMQGTRVPRAETLSKMAKNLNTTTDFILTGENLTPLEESFSKDFYEMYKIAIKISPKMTMQQRKTIIDILLE